MNINIDPVYNNSFLLFFYPRKFFFTRVSYYKGGNGIQEIERNADGNKKHCD